VDQWAEIRRLYFVNGLRSWDRSTAAALPAIRACGALVAG
jgi:hypothetical protein